MPDSPSAAHPPAPEDLVLVARALKPYGLVGELKVKPESGDPERHHSLERLWFKKRPQDPPEPLEVRASRHDGQFWYLKFKGLRTPEAVAPYSGGMLYIPAAERPEAPEGMIYISDIIGLAAVDGQGRILGTIKDVLDNHAQDLIRIQTPKGEVSVPWVDAFVLEVDLGAGKVVFDAERLEGLV